MQQNGLSSPAVHSFPSVRVSSLEDADFAGLLYILAGNDFQQRKRNEGNWNSTQEKCNIALEQKADAPGCFPKHRLAADYSFGSNSSLSTHCISGVERKNQTRSSFKNGMSPALRKLFFLACTTSDTSRFPLVFFFFSTMERTLCRKLLFSRTQAVMRSRRAFFPDFLHDFTMRLRLVSS